jgi:hypothetical protein
VSRGPNCVFCNECKELEVKYELEDLVSIQDGDYIIEIESTMSLRPDDIVSAAF